MQPDSTKADTWYENSGKRRLRDQQLISLGQQIKADRNLFDGETEHGTNENMTVPGVEKLTDWEKNLIFQDLKQDLENARHRQSRMQDIQRVLISWLSVARPNLPR